MIVCPPGTRVPVSLDANQSQQLQFTVTPGGANSGRFDLSTGGNDKLSAWNVTDSAGNQVPGLSSGAGTLPGIVFIFFVSNNTMPSFYPTLVPGDYIVNVTGSDTPTGWTAEYVPPQVPGHGGRR